MFQDGSDNNANNVKMNKRKQKEAKINHSTVAEEKEIEITTTDEQEQSLLSKTIAYSKDMHAWTKKRNNRETHVIKGMLFAFT